MLTKEQISEISSLAWIPEHLVEYVVAITGKEPHMMEPYVCYTGRWDVVVVGYPLEGQWDKGALQRCLEQAREKFPRKRTIVISQEIPPIKGLKPKDRQDFYFKLELGELNITAKVRNMLRRASREVEVTVHRDFSQEHRELMEEFLDAKDLGPEQEELIRKIPMYISQVESSLVFSAWNKRGNLVAFTVGHFTPGPWGFYMFNITSPSRRVPGTSDLLLHGLILEARKRGNVFLNLGLGMTRGVSFFKEKWGASPFVPYREGIYREGLVEKAIGFALAFWGPRN